MIKVTLELVSAINPDRSKVLGVGMISNDRDTSIKTNGKLGTYKIEFTKSQEIDIPSGNYNIKLSKRETEMKTKYREIEFGAGQSIESAVKELKEQKDLVCGSFNGEILYSDIDDVDSAYKKNNR